MTKFNKTVLFIFVAAFLIRLIALNQSLWLDEATTARVVQQYNYQEIIAKFSPHDFHPPLYYLLMKAWTNIFGYSEVALRFPSIIFSLLTGYIVYKIVSLFHGFIVGAWSAAFFLFNPLIVYYSQEARMYVMATFFLTTALYYFLRKNHIFFGLFGILGLLTFYGSIFLIISMFIYLLYKKQYKFFLISCFLFFVSFAIISPLLYQQIINAKVSLTSVANWSYVLGKANLKNLLLIPVKFSIGRISFEPKWIYYLIAGGWTAFIWLTIIKKLKVKNQNYNSKVKSLTYLLVTPFILGFIVSFVTPLLQYFRFLYLIPIMAILLTKNKITMYQYIVTAGFLVFSLVYLLIPQFHREDWRNLVKSLPDDKPVYIILSSSDPVMYYNNKLTIKELRITDYGLKENEIIIIPFTAEVYGFDYKTVLKEKNFSLINKKSFRELELETWKRIN